MLKSFVKMLSVGCMLTAGSAFANGISVNSTAGITGDDIAINAVGYGGTGCPQNTASVVLSPDAKTLSILFDQYVAEAGSTTGKFMDRKNCNLSIGLRVPQGLSVSIFKVDYRGYNFVPRGASSDFSVEYFFASQRGPKAFKQFVGPIDQEFMLTNNLAMGALVWSPCGEDVILRANTAATVRTNSKREQALISVDSADVGAKLVYHLQFQRCGGGSPSYPF